LLFFASVAVKWMLYYIQRILKFTRNSKAYSETDRQSAYYTM